MRFIADPLLTNAYRDKSSPIGSCCVAAELNGSVRNIGSNQRSRIVQALIWEFCPIRDTFIGVSQNDFFGDGKMVCRSRNSNKILRMRGGRIVKEQIEKMWREVVVEDR